MSLRLSCTAKQANASMEMAAKAPTETSAAAQVAALLAAGG